MNKTTSAPKKAASKKADVKTDAKSKIFQEIRSVMVKYIPPLAVLRDTENIFELTATKTVEFMGKKRNGIYFGAVMVKKGFVGFYLMTIYAQPGLVQKLGPDLKKLLKGKSCFHVNKLTQELLQQIKDSIETGIECYRKLGFI